MRQFGGKINKYTLSSELKIFGANGSLKQGRETHHYIIKNGYDMDVVVATALIDMYAKCGLVEEAHKAFDMCPHRDVVSWNAIISAHTIYGNGSAALELFRDMQSNGDVIPSKVSFILALKACGLESSVQNGRCIHDFIVRHGIALDEVYGSSLIDMYCKCGNVHDANKVFGFLPLKNVFSWGALMAGYVQNGLESKALQLFSEMCQHGIPPNPVILSSTLKACGAARLLELGKLLHDHILENSLNGDAIVSNALVDMYAKCGEFKEAWQVLHKLSSQSERSWGALIGGCIQQDYFEMALNLFVEMQAKGNKANEIIYSCVLKACGSIGAINEGRVLQDQIFKRNLETTKSITNNIIEMHASLGCLSEAQKMFDILPRNIGSWEAIIAGYMKSEQDALALKCFEKACTENVQPSEAMFSCVVKACGTQRSSLHGRLIHGQIVKAFFMPDVVVVNSLIDMYLNCGSLDEARNVFEQSSNRDVVSWNSLIGGYVQFGFEHSAIDLFYRMLRLDCKPDRVTYLCMLKAFGSSGALPQGRFIHNQTVESGCESDIAVQISLIDMFAKCGSLEDARKLLDGPAQNDIGSWAAMIAGYAQHGECRMARQCFCDMEQHGLKPDVATFTVVLAACCHSGQVKEGYWYFNAMKDKYGIPPKIEHFNCLIDLLGRSGQLNDAIELLKAMPELPDIMGWMSLLTACRKYGKFMLGQKCFEAILNIDPENRAAYALMSSIYSDAQMWDEVAKVERLRECANAWKKPATAWIEVDDDTHEFMVGVQDFPQNNIVSNRLKSLKQRMAAEGYVPRLDVVVNRKPEESTENLMNLSKDSEFSLTTEEFHVGMDFSPCKKMCPFVQSEPFHTALNYEVTSTYF